MHYAHIYIYIYLSIYIYYTYTFVFWLGKNPPESSCFIARPATGECREATSERSGAHRPGIDPFCMIVFYEVHHFSEGLVAKNHQPVMLYQLYQLYLYFSSHHIPSGKET